MKRIVFVLLLLASATAFGQGTIVPPKTVMSVVNGVLRPIANATITVCAANASGKPCSPALPNALFQDPGFTQPLTNPFTTDVNGNYQFAIASGLYTVTETGIGFAGYSYQISVSCGSPCNSGPLTITNPGVFTNAQMNLYVQSLVNNCDPTTEYQAVSGNTATQTEGITGCVTAPLGSSALNQVVGVQGYVHQLSSTSPAIGIQGYARGGIFGGASIHGGIFVAADAGAGFPNNNLWGSESYVISNNVSSIPVGHSIGGAFSAQPTSGAAMDVLPIVAISGGPYTWPFAFRLETAATATPSGSGGGFLSNPVAAGTNQNSQGFVYVSNDPVAGQNVVTHYELPDGEFAFNFSKAGAGLRVGGPLNLTGSTSGVSSISAPPTGGGAAVLPPGPGTLCYTSTCTGAPPFIVATATMDNTGVADISAALIAAGNACNGGTIWFGPGSYRQAALVTINTPCNILAWNRTARIFKDYNSTTGVPGAHGSVILTSSNSSVNGIEYDGNDTGGRTGDCFSIANAVTDTLFDGNYFHNCDGSTVTVTATAGGGNGPTRTAFRHNKLIGGAHGAVIALNQGLNTIDIDDNPLIDGSRCGTVPCTSVGLGTINAAAQGGNFNGGTTPNAIVNLHIRHNTIVGTSTWCTQTGGFNAYSMTGLIIEGNQCILSQAANGGFSFPGNYGAIVSHNQFSAQGFSFSLGMLESAGSTGTVAVGNYCDCENPGTGGFFWGDGALDSDIADNVINGGGETGGASISLNNGYTHDTIKNDPVIPGLSETGNVVLVQETGTLSVKFQPGIAIAICDASNDCHPRANTYFGYYPMADVNYNRAAGTFSYISPYTGLAPCVNPCVAIVAGATANNKVHGNKVKLPYGGTLSGNPTGISIRNISGDVEAITGNVVSENVISGGNLSGGESCGTSSGAGIVGFDSNTYQYNECTDVFNGFIHAQGTNASFIKNKFVNVANQYTGSVAGGAYTGTAYIDFLPPTVAPTCAFTTGGGTGPSCTLDTGSTNDRGIIKLTTGTGAPAASGSATLTFGANFGINKVVCNYNANNQGSAWSTLPAFTDSVPAVGSDLFAWINGTSNAAATALSTTSTYWINYTCAGK